ncbi:hypothetical protein ACHAWF_013883 [Thalassiosira exigua]
MAAPAAAPTAESVAAAFPTPVFPRLTTAPTREDIDNMYRMSIENAASRITTRGGGNHGHAGMVVEPPVYAAHYSPVPYVMEANPGETPLYPPGVTTAQRRNIDNQFSRVYQIFREQSAVHTALKKQLYRAVPQDYWAGLIDQHTGLATVTLRDMYTYLFQNYGVITPADHEANRQRITEQFDFGSQSVEVYYRILCDKDCNGMFTKDKAWVTYKGRVILKAPRRANGLWYLQPSP